MRVEASADHGGELVVSGAQVGPDETSDVRRVALEGGVMLVQTGRVVVVVRGYQRVQVLVVLLLGSVLQGRRRRLLTCMSQLVGRGAVVPACSHGSYSHGGSRGVMLVLLVFVTLPGQLLLLVLEPLLPTQVAPVLEHIPAVGVQSPEGSLPGLVGGPSDLNEAVVEAQRVPDGILPALLVLSVVREQVHDELVDLRQRQHLARRVLDRHGDQADVGIRWLRVRVASAVRLIGSRPLQSRIRRVGLRQGQRIPGDRCPCALSQRTIPDGTHTGPPGAHGGAPVSSHASAAHGCHTHRRAHGAHVETAGALRAAARPDSNAHGHAHRHAAHRVYRAVRRRHAVHRGHRGAGHRAAEATGVAVQLLRLEHGHRTNRCRGGGLLAPRQTRVMKTAIPRLLVRRFYLLLRGRRGHLSRVGRSVRNCSL